MAAVQGTQEEWDALEIEWRKRIGGRVFHAADCENDAGDFADIPHQENLDLYKDLTTLIVNTRMLGVGYAIDLAGFNAAFPYALPDQPYFKCFVRVVTDSANEAYRLIPREKVKFTFDHGMDSEYHAGSLYNYMLHQVEWNAHVCLHDEIGFACGRTFPIPVVDLVARETMKWLDNHIGPVKRKLRGSMESLMKTGRFHFTYLMGEYFTDLWLQMTALEEREGITRQQLEEWLVKYNRQDNNSNRLRFLIECESAERQRGPNQVK